MTTPFFLDKLPANADYCSVGHFFNQCVPERMAEFLGDIQVLDTRVTEENLRQWTYEPPRQEFARFFEIKDFQESKTDAEVLLSLSLFKMAGERSTTGKTFDVYLSGLQNWIEFLRAERPEIKLRVYVGHSAWDILHHEKILEATDVDFVRMASSSSYSEVGTFWRFLAFDDYRYPYVCIDDTDFAEHRSTAQINNELKGLKRNTAVDDGFTHFGGWLVVFSNKHEEQEGVFPQEFSLFFWSDDNRLCEPLFIYRLSEHIQLSSIRLTRSPFRLPFKMIPMLCSHLARYENRVIYHPARNIWTSIRERHPNLQFRYVDEHWLFHLTKVVKVKIITLSHCLLEYYPHLQRYGKGWFVKRICDNLIADGNLFCMQEKEDYGSPFDYSDEYWEHIKEYG